MRERERGWGVERQRCNEITLHICVTFDQYLGDNHPPTPVLKVHTVVFV